VTVSVQLFRVGHSINSPTITLQHHVKTTMSLTADRSVPTSTAALSVPKCQRTFQSVRRTRHHPVVSRSAANCGCADGMRAAAATSPSREHRLGPEKMLAINRWRATRLKQYR